MAVFEYSIFQYLIVSLITILNPWDMIGDDTKSRIINKTINTSVQILRSQEIETIYDSIDINPLKDTVTIKDINFTYYIKNENDICTSEQLFNDNYNKSKDMPFYYFIKIPSIYSRRNIKFLNLIHFSNKLDINIKTNIIDTPKFDLKTKIDKDMESELDIVNKLGKLETDNIGKKVTKYIRNDKK